MELEVIIQSNPLLSVTIQGEEEDALPLYNHIIHKYKPSELHKRPILRRTLREVNRI